MTQASPVPVVNGTPAIEPMGLRSPSRRLPRARSVIPRSMYAGRAPRAGTMARPPRGSRRGVGAMPERSRSEAILDGNETTRAGASDRCAAPSERDDLECAVTIDVAACDRDEITIFGGHLFDAVRDERNRREVRSYLAVDAHCDRAVSDGCRDRLAGAVPYIASRAVGIGGCAKLSAAISIST